MPRHHWTEADRANMREHYPNRPTREVAAMIGVSVKQCYAQASVMGLRKSEQYLNDPDSGRFLPGVRRSPETEFRPGQAAHNKGKGMHPETYRKCAPTMFKPGRAAHEARNYKPIGSLRISRDGALERKVTDDPNAYPARRWTPVARLVWEAEHGPIPPDHIVRFRDGMQTTVEAEITLDRLECISKSENMRRNSVHNLPAPLPQLVQLKGALVRKIRTRERKRA